MCRFLCRASGEARSSTAAWQRQWREKRRRSSWKKQWSRRISVFQWWVGREAQQPGNKHIPPEEVQKIIDSKGPKRKGDMLVPDISSEKLWQQKVHGSCPIKKSTISSFPESSLLSTERFFGVLWWILDAWNPFFHLRFYKTPRWQWGNEGFS